MRELPTIAQQTTGMHYRHPTALALIGAIDWGDYYPEVDEYGYLTGGVVAIGEAGYLNVGDDVYVRADTLSEEQLRNVEDGMLGGIPDEVG
tara:strand:- start:102 stop:374 length:273 start_codon:yes stop_codon:yes gene_type:complete